VSGLSRYAPSGSLGVHGLHHGKYEKGVGKPKMSVAEIKSLVGDTLPTDKAIRKDKWTEILFRALSNRVAKRWRFVSFRGAKGGEWCGVVDIIAIRKDTAKSNDEIIKSGDLFEIILVQLKGGSADMPTPDDIQRLKAVAARYHAKKVVLFEWRQTPPKGTKTCCFSVLNSDTWSPSTADDIFG
jgi:hypothetical protein